MAVIGEELLVKRVPAELAFRFFDGALAYSLAELMNDINDARFAHHVVSGRNDFAAWVRDVFHEEDLAHKLSAAKDASELFVVLKRLESVGNTTLVSVPMRRDGPPPSLPSLEIPSLDHDLSSDRAHQVTQHTAPQNPVRQVPAGSALGSGPAKNPITYAEIVDAWHKSALQVPQPLSRPAQGVVTERGSAQLGGEVRMVENRDVTRELVQQAISSDVDVRLPMSLPQRAQHARGMLFWGIWDFLLGALIGFGIGYFVVRLLL